MKTRSAAVQYLVAATIALTCTSAFADHNRGCSPRTLRGTYVFHATGYRAQPGSTTMNPKAILEVIEFAGDGTLNVVISTVANRAGDGAITSNTNAPGQYQLDPMCTGTLAFSDGPTFNIFAEAKGDTVWMIQTNPGNVLEGTVTRVER